MASFVKYNVGLQQERTICLAGKTEKIEKQSLQLAEKSAERSTATIEYPIINSLSMNAIGNLVFATYCHLYIFFS